MCDFNTLSLVSRTMSMLDSPNFSASYHVGGADTRRQKGARPPQPRKERPSDGRPDIGGAADRTDNGRDRDATPPEEPTGDMRREEERLATFADWKVSFMSPRDLAANGFYYFGRGDEVRCAFCRVEIGLWEEGDDPAVDHERWAPQCPLLRRRPTGNVPLPRGRDECGTRAPQPSPRRTEPPLAPLDSATVFTAPSGPTHPRYASESARLRSFAEWPRSMKQKSDELADAGFYYTGQGDKTVCFYCGGGLKDWEEDDDPWEQHARWFGRCAYVLLNKGAAYVHKVNNQLATPARDGSAAAPVAVPAAASTVCAIALPAATPSTVSTADPVSANPEAKLLPTRDGSSSTTAPISFTPEEKFLQSRVEPGSMESLPVPPPSPDKKIKDDRNLCKICYGEERDVCFIPCGHVVACSKCALASSTCPMCRRPFTSTVRLFYS